MQLFPTFCFDQFSALVSTVPTSQLQFSHWLVKRRHLIKNANIKRVQEQSIESYSIWVIGAITDTFLLLYRLHGATSCLYMENTNQPLLLINEIGADVFKAAHTKVHIQIELS